ncbi:MAG: N-formylglutamate amidohydrolase [Planctomycetes bacterium]|nr:N-formylglutamate amidohydrolase [Planctomycetota bacterium]
MTAALASRPGICDVELVRGASCPPDAVPDVLFEVPHGATRSAHFAALRAQLRGAYADDLQDFFHVNTDVGAPELARATAERIVQLQPRRSAVVVRCLLPRTFVDCNRRIEPGATPAASAAGAPTPGMGPWVQDPHDRALLYERYDGYRAVATAAFAAVCGRGGLGLCVHTYAPRSIEVAVDGDIVASLHAAYAADRIGSWPLRPAIDLITHDPDGRELAAPALAARAEAEFTAAGFEVERNGAYSLHPVTLAHEFATRYPAATLCFEVRRDLLVPAFTPFREMTPDPQRVARAAAPLAVAVLASLR